jgi:WD40 repeat protein
VDKLRLNKRRIAIPLLLLVVCLAVILVFLVLNSIRIRRDSTAAFQYDFSDRDGIRCLCFTRDSRMLVAGARNGTLITIDMQSQSVREFNAHRRMITSIGFDQNESYLVTSNEEGETAIWKWPEMARHCSFECNGCVTHSFFASDKSVVICRAGVDGSVFTLDVPTCRSVQIFEARKPHTAQSLNYPAIHDAALVDDRILVAIGNNLIELGRDGSERRSVLLGAYQLIQVTTIPRYATIACANNEKVWLLPTTDLSALRVIEHGDDGSISAICVSPNNDILALAVASAWNEPSIIQLWDWRANKKIGQFKRHVGSVWCLCFSPDGKWLAHGGPDGKVMLESAELYTRP